MTRQADNTCPINLTDWRKPISFLLIAVLTTILLSPAPVEAKKSKRHYSGGGGGGGGGGGSGVVLQTPPPRNPLEHNNRGVELGSKGLWPDAIREHEEALNM